MFNFIYYKHMGRCSARSSESHIVLLCIFYCLYHFNWLYYTIFKNFLVHILSIYIMYQVLQVYTSFSFFDNFFSRSIKVGQSSSRRRRLRVAETSSQLFLNYFVSSSLGDVSKTSRRRRGDVFLLENIFSRCDVAATSPRPTGDLKKSPKSRRKNRICLISPRRLRDPRRLELPTGRQLVSMPVR